MLKVPSDRGRAKRPVAILVRAAHDHRFLRLLAWLCVTWLLLPHAAGARLLVVGPGQPYAGPGEAAQAAQVGDHVQILAGTYYGCAVWKVDDLVIEGAGADTVVTDNACEGKAGFVIRARGVTVRDITFARVRVPDENGAGIRAEGPDLLVERVHFINNQEGLLAISLPGSHLRIVDCVFTDNGVISRTRLPATVEVGEIGRLDIRNSRFEQARAGAAVISRADFTDITGSHMTAVVTPPDSQRGATILVSGGIRMEDTTVQASATPANGPVAVQALPAPADADLLLNHVTLEGKGTLLLNWSGRSPVLAGNTLGPDGVEVSSAGAWSYRLRRFAHQSYDELHGLAYQAARRARDVIRSAVAKTR